MTALHTALLLNKCTYTVPTHTYTHTCAHTHMCTHIRTYTHILTYIPTHIRTHTHAHSHTHTHTHLHTHTHTHTHTCIHTHLHTHTHTHTHTHLHAAYSVCCGSSDALGRSRHSLLPGPDPGRAGQPQRVGSEQHQVQGHQGERLNVRISSSRSCFNSNPKFSRRCFNWQLKHLLNFGLELKKLRDEFY